jgi:hypothetical protein
MQFCVAGRKFTVLAGGNYNVQQKSEPKFLKVYTQLKALSGA